MKIESDFRDWYDHAASGEGPVLRRMATDRSMSKRDQFRILEEAGFTVPLYGDVEFVMGWMNDVVVYDDELAHCGEGKRLLNYKQYCVESWESGIQNAFCSAFVGNPGESLRLLQLGKMQFWIEYKSNESWMSNVGDGTVELVDYDLQAGLHPKIRLPIWAVDFVIDQSGRRYAIDFNTAPGCKWTGIEKVVSAADVVKSLEEAVIELEQK